MAAFLYRAVDTVGKPRRGVIEAASEAGARRLLREQALLPLSIHVGSATPAGRRASFGFARHRLPARTLSTVTRQLATLIGSDVGIERAIALAAEQAETTRVRSLLLELRGDILDGQSLAGALTRHGREFPDYYRSSIAAGEQSGRLPHVLETLADYVEKSHRAEQKVRLALLYPALLAVISLSMMVLLMIYVVPDIVRVFETHGADLPFLTRALIGISHAVRSFGWVLVLLLAGGGFVLRRWLTAPANRLAFHRELATRRPFRRIVRQAAATRFAGTLGQLVGSAVPLVDALGAAAAVTGNLYLREQALAVAAQVREGRGLATAMSHTGAYPPMLIAIVASGEASGRLAPALERAASELEREHDALTTVIVSLVEPAVLLLMGGVVLLMVLAILLPIINLNNLAAS